MMQKNWDNIFYVILNANLKVQYVIQIKIGKIRHVNMRVKIIVYAKKIVAGIITLVFVKILDI